MDHIETTLPVTGMHCDGCANTISTVLSRIEGVILAEADFERGEVHVRFDPDRASEQDLLEGVRAAGYEPG